MNGNILKFGTVPIGQPLSPKEFQDALNKLDEAILTTNQTYNARHAQLQEAYNSAFDAETHAGAARDKDSLNRILQLEYEIAIQKMSYASSSKELNQNIMIHETKTHNLLAYIDCIATAIETHHPQIARQYNLRKNIISRLPKRGPIEKELAMALKKECKLLENKIKNPNKKSIWSRIMEKMPQGNHNSKEYTAKEIANIFSAVEEKMKQALVASNALVTSSNELFKNEQKLEQLNHGIYKNAKQLKTLKRKEKVKNTISNIRKAFSNNRVNQGHSTHSTPKISSKSSNTSRS